MAQFHLSNKINDLLPVYLLCYFYTEQEPLMKVEILTNNVQGAKCDKNATF